MTTLATTARERLQNRRRILLGHIRAPNDLNTLPDVDRAGGDAGAITTRLLNHETRELREIDAALARIEEGHYGRCESCAGAIGRQRLAAIPEARLCIRCSDATAATL